jgi:hypothetical protein
MTKPKHWFTAKLTKAKSTTRSPAVAGMADSWPQINHIDFHFRDLEMTA